MTIINTFHRNKYFVYCWPLKNLNNRKASIKIKKWLLMNELQAAVNERNSNLQVKENFASIYIYIYIYIHKLFSNKNLSMFINTIVAACEKLTKITNLSPENLSTTSFTSHTKHLIETHYSVGPQYNLFSSHSKHLIETHYSVGPQHNLFSSHTKHLIETHYSVGPQHNLFYLTQ